MVKPVVDCAVRPCSRGSLSVAMSVRRDRRRWAGHRPCGCARL